MEESNIVRSFNELPIPFQSRRTTDRFCTLLAALFALVIFVLACIFFNANSIARWKYPTDSASKTCGSDHKDFPYMYFASISDPSKRLCLSECPQMGDQNISSYKCACKDNILQSGNIDIYNTRPEQTMMGRFCLPTDQQLRANLVQKGGIEDRYRVLQAFKSIGWSLLVALLIGAVYMALVQAFPERMIEVSIFAGAISMITLGIMLMLFKSQAYPRIMVFRYVLGVIAIIFGATLVAMFAIYRKELRIVGVFLREAGNYVKSKPLIYLAIPVFLVLIALLAGLSIFQYLAFFSMGQIYHTGLSPYYQLKSGFGSGFLHFLNLVEFFWGLNFLREASAYILSGFVIGWYTQKPINPVKGLLLRHWGSVVACAFMVGFFSIPDTIYLFLAPRKTSSNSCARLTRYVLSPLQSLSRFIRGEAMAYINLTGIPYCNSSDYCEYLTHKSSLARHEGDRPLIRYYRYAAYSFLVSLVLIFCVVYENQTIGMVPFLSVLTIGVVGLFVVSGFVDIHADIAAALLLTYMLETELLTGATGDLSGKGQQIRARLEPDSR